MKTIAASELRRAPYILITILTILAAGIITAGCLYYQHYKENYRLEVERRLSAVAELKVNELVSWRNERLSDAGVFYRNAAFSALVQRFFETPDDVETAEQIRTWLSQVQAAHKYERVMLLDAQAVERISVPDTLESVAGHPAVDTAQVLRSGEVTLLDFHRHAPNYPICLDVLVPIFDGQDENRAIGILTLDINSETYLYPFINRWPTPSRTAETLIVRREGNEAVFLNELKFQKNTALNLRVPLANNELPAVKAALGKEGIVEGIDYSGTPVIAAVRAVPDSPWFLVARMGTSEVYAPIKEKLWAITIFVGVLLMAAGVSVGLIWKQQAAYFYRKQSEAGGALRESEAKYRTLLEHLPQKVFLKDRNSVYVSCNENYAKDLGISSEHLPGKSDYDFYPEALAWKYRQDDRRIMQSGETTELDESYLSAGQQMTVHTVKTPVHDEKGNVSGVLGIFWDVTEQKQAEESIRKFKFMVENAGQEVYLVKPEGELAYVNDAAARSLGYTAEEMLEIGVPGFDPKFGPVFRQHFEDLKTRNLPVFETVHLAKDGRRIPKEMKSVYLRIGDQEYVCGFGQDITERKQAEEKIKIFSKAVKGAYDSFVLTDMNGNVTYANESAINAFGYLPEEIMKLNVAQFTANTEDAAKIIKVMKTKEGWGGELTQIRKNKETFPVILSASLLRDDEGNPTGMMGVFRDITERKQMEEDLRSAKTQAEAANEAKSEFLANMSHEIRTPLNAIIGFSEILACEDFSDEQTEWIKTIRDSGEHLLELINDILDFSKIEAGRMDLEMIEYSLENLCAKVESLMRPAAMKKGLEFGFRKKGILPARIRTDLMRLSQCLLNLVSNAVKFTEKGHVYVNISLEEVDDEPCIRFDVEDTGIGIPLEKQQLIFESFTQADGSTTRRFGGSGLGLAITKRLTELLGGWVSVSSEEGKGSVFSLVVPIGLDPTGQAPSDERELADESSAERSQPRRTAPDVEFKFTGRALVAEDAVTNQMLIKVMLERMGLEVTMVKDGAEAVREGLDQSYDLIFMDIQMPNMSGYEATRRLRKKGLTTPIIALTANAMEGDEKKCIEAGCDDYLPKPIERAKLMEITRKYLTPQPQDLSGKIDSVKSGVDDLGRLCSKDAAPQADSADAASAEDVIDWDQLISRVVEEGIAGEIVPLCVADNRERLEMLAGAVRTGNAEDVKLYAHAIKGSAGNIGAGQLSDVAAQLEQMAYHGDLSQAEQLLQAIKTEFARLEAFISNPDWMEMAKRQSSGEQPQ